MMVPGVLLGLFLLSVTLIATGLWFAQGKTRPRRPPGEPMTLGLEPAPVSNRQLTPRDLGWQRPLAAPMAWTKMNAVLLIGIVIGPLGVTSLLTIVGLTYYLDLSAWPGQLLWIALFLLILSVLALLLINGLREWQTVKALEARGQLAQGVLLDRWGVPRRGYVAYYFDLPGGSAPIVRGEINDEAHRAYQVGDLVRVRYLPDNPQVCRLEI
jgi:hypothetical protein